MRLLLTISGLLTIIQIVSCVCSRNQKWTLCGSACPITCTDPPKKVCKKRCVAGCQCSKGFILDESTKECVMRHDCVCGTNQRMAECGTACPSTCKQLKPRPCIKMCMRGCECEPGYVFNQSNQCIKIDEC